MESLTVDFAGFAKGDDEKRFIICQNLVKKLQEHGTARLINCGVSNNVSSHYMELVGKKSMIIPQRSLITVSSFSP